MPKCEKCGVEVSIEDIYEDEGLKVCEDCKLNGIMPPDLHPYFANLRKKKTDDPEQS